MVSFMRLNDVTRKTQLSVDLIKRWGETRLPNGKKLVEMLTYDSIPFWEIVSVVIALHHLPKALYLYKRPPLFLPRTLTYLRRFKYEMINRRHYPWKVRSHCWPTNPVFLFLGFQPYIYRDTLYPIVSNMASDKEISPVSLYEYLPLERSCKEIAGNQFQSIWQHWDSDVEDRAAKLKKLLRTAIKELKEMAILPQIIKNQEESLWLRMKDTFDWLFIAYLPYLINHFALARHILQNHCPEVIISPDISDPRNRLYCLLGRLLNIPTLEVQFGAYGQESLEWQFFLADRIAAWGQTSRVTLISHKVPAEKIVLTGSPRHDSMVSVSSSEVAQIRLRLGIADGVLLVLFASTYLSVDNKIGDPSLIDSAKRSVFQAADQIDGISLVVKPHPNEKTGATKKLASGLRNILFVDKDRDIRELIRACDVFISLGSTSTVDAIIANKLVICPSFPGWVWSDVFIGSGAILVPRSEEELFKCFKIMKDSERQKIIADLEPARQRFLRDWIFKVDGQASDRIKHLLLDMSRNRKSAAEVTVNGLKGQEDVCI